MPIEITSLPDLSERNAVEEILREYLIEQIEGIFEISGTRVELEFYVQETMNSMDAYLPPLGRTLVARDAAGDMQGIVFLKMVNPGRAEFKRLHVRKAARGRGLGRKMTEAVMHEARELGANTLLLDTGIWMKLAPKLYKSMGFKEIPAYPENKNHEIAKYLIYMECAL